MIPQGPESAGSPRILLIEDNRGDVILALRAFRAAGISAPVRVAESGETALAILRGEGETHADLPDVIFVDLNLPKMNGKEVLAAVRENAILQHIPVIILTSSFAPQDRAASDRLKADGYILKPLDSEKIRALAAFVIPPILEGRGLLSGAVS
jgi:chemotaxis family two-component system response regulator Rcp1